jgi:ribonuclease-3
MDRLESAEQSLGLSFGRRELLELALVHSSYLNENPDAFDESNERLEFLGDAAIGLVVGQEIYDRFPDRDEGELTELRSALVRGDTLARTAASLRLGQFILMGRGEEAGGGRERKSALAAVFEAVVGAVLLDGGYQAARAFTLRVLAEEFEAVSGPLTLASAKSALQELVQSQGNPPPSYRIAGTEGADHSRQFTAEVIISGEVAGTGTGSRKAVAEQNAAKAALEALNRSG